MSRAIAVLEYLASVEEQNVVALKMINHDRIQAKALIDLWSDQAAKKVVAIATVRKLMLDELEAAATAAPAASA